MAVAAVVCVLAARRSARLAGAISYLPAVTLGLASAGIAILAISSELPEILTISDRILTMREGRITG